MGIVSKIDLSEIRTGEYAIFHLVLQAVAAEGRLGIPLTLSSDPRNHFSSVTGVMGFKTFGCEPICIDSEAT